MASKAIQLFTAGTPNGQKVSIFLEVLKLKYEVHPIDIMKNEQKEPWFLEMNPNGRIPTLVDKNTNTTLSETAAIMTYLADKYDTERKFSYEVGTPEYYKQLEFVYFQMAGLGPMQGQANHFVKYAPEKVPYGIKRYLNETRRLYSVFEEYLKRNEANGPYIVGTHYSLADFVTVGWASSTPVLDIDLNDYPHVATWFKELVKLPGVMEGFHVPTPPRVFPEL